jgi:hypothetical protein
LRISFPVARRRHGHVQPRCATPDREARQRGRERSSAEDGSGHKGCANRYFYPAGEFTRHQTHQARVARDRGTNTKPFVSELITIRPFSSITPIWKSRPLRAMTGSPRWAKPGETSRTPATLERSVEGLTGGKPVPKSVFEERISGKLTGAPSLAQAQESRPGSEDNGGPARCR